MSLAHTLLALLAKKSNCGYNFSKQLDESWFFYWQATQQQVYRELSKMESKGWILSDKIIHVGKPDKKVYHIVDKGWSEFTR